jgi:hypothetical protein
MKRFEVRVNINGSRTDVYDTKTGVFVTRHAIRRNAVIIAANLNKEEQAKKK